MRVYWMLRGGESVEIYDGSDAATKDKVVIYRVGVERMVQAEVKVVRTKAPPKIINADSRIRTIDVAATGALFLEVVGPTGVAFGWYELASGD
jgi:hypothetical protein